jgi:hypothetical protein
MQMRPSTITIPTGMTIAVKVVIGSPNSVPPDAASAAVLAHTFTNTEKKTSERYNINDCSGR